MKIMFAFMIAGVAMFAAAPAYAQNPTVRCRGLNTPCVLQPPSVRMNVGNPYAQPQRSNVRMPFTQQNVGGRQMVILPPRHHQQMGRGMMPQGGGIIPSRHPMVTGPVAMPTGQPYVASETTIVENGIRYTGKSCRRAEGTEGREGYGSDGGLGCWRF